MLSVAQAAKQLNISRQRVLKLIQSDSIKARKIGKQWIIESLKDYESLPPGRPPKFPKLGLLILASAPVLAYLYTKLFEYQGF